MPHVACVQRFPRRDESVGAVKRVPQVKQDRQGLLRARSARLPLRQRRVDALSSKAASASGVKCVLNSAAASGNVLSAHGPSQSTTG